MPNPRRARDISLGFLASGLLAVPLALLLSASAGALVPGLLASYGVAAAVFGGISAWVLHSESRATADTTDFFHGLGDGSDPEDLSRCLACGHTTHEYASRCPRCGGSLQSRRWARRFGGALVVCGFFITCVMAVVISRTAPMLLEPGASAAGGRFSGSAEDRALVTAVLALVAAFGVGTMLYGLWQVRTGARSLRVIRLLVALVAIVFLIALVL